MNVAEYLSPGVYIEETSFRAKYIEGVSTSTCGIVGVTSFGPTSGRPQLVTSYVEFQRTYGGWDDLSFTDGSSSINYTAHAVRAFFDNGGKRLYVARVYSPDSAHDGIAKLQLPALAGGGPTRAVVRARFPGSAGDNLRVTIEAVPIVDHLNAVVTNPDKTTTLKNVYPGAMLMYASAAPTAKAPISPTDANAQFAFVTSSDSGLGLLDVHGSAITPLPVFAGLVELKVSVYRGTAQRPDQVYSNLSPNADAANFIGRVLHPDHPTDDSALVTVSDVYGVDPSTGAVDSTHFDATQLVQYLLGKATSSVLGGGYDGKLPADSDYDGDDDEIAPKGLYALDRVDDIAIVIAPDASAMTFNTDTAKNANTRQAIVNHVITHCQNQRYRFAVLDVPAKSKSEDALRFRSQFDSSYAALYYPWVVISDPRSGHGGDPLTLPPSGFAAGIYARSDVNRGVFKAPANEVVNDAIDFELHVNQGIQDVLNPRGVNCLRFFEATGYRVWGARTISSDPDWTYVNVRRLLIYLEHSIDNATQWAVFEPNNEALWLKVRLTIESFLTETWRTGALMGTQPSEAFFVRCDRTTMTQSDLDNGRLVCLVGVAPTKPAEFVIFQIGQWTADASIV
jgi:phage tail sheath protein FI